MSASSTYPSPGVVALLRALEWKGCGCAHPEESACPACAGKEPLSEMDHRLTWYGHAPDCALACFLSGPMTQDRLLAALRACEAMLTQAGWSANPQGSPEQQLLAECRDILRDVDG